MEDILIVNAVGLGATVPDMAAIDALPIGSVVAVGDGRKVLSTTSTAADLDDVKSVNFLTKISTGKFKKSVDIPRRAITSVNYQVYTAPQPKRIRIGGITASDTLNIEAQGEANIRVGNLSYNHVIATNRVNISRTKRNTETPEQFVDRLVVALNTAPNNVMTPFYTAVKVEDGTSTYFAIDITATDESVDLNVGVDGMFEFNYPTVTQQPKVSTGKGADVVQMEKDLSRNRGNNNYVELTDLWWKVTNESVAGTNYNMITITWTGIAPHGATSKMIVAVNTLSLAIPTGSSATALLALVNLIVGTAFLGDGAGGAEVGTNGATNATDNNPAT